MRKFFVLGICLAASIAHASEDSLTVVVNDKTSVFALKDLEKKLKTVKVTVDDPVYREKKSFDGFRLTEILALAGLDSKAVGDEIVFTAKDGYSPNTSFEKIRNHSAVLTYQEHGGARRHFGKVEQGKTRVSPGPFYLVWEEGKALGKTVPWPYQVVKIEVVQFATKYANLFPAAVKADPGAAKGFLTFKNECVRCHSMNLQGGDVGPELNSPKNITEYWDRATLREFIRNPLAFRYKSKMPAFPQLTPAEIDDLLAYFVLMKENKAAP